MGTFKKTECNPICKVFTEVFLILKRPLNWLKGIITKIKEILNKTV